MITLFSASRKDRRITSREKSSSPSADDVMKKATEYFQQAIEIDLYFRPTLLGNRPA
jgi:hypothetical protein